MSHTTKRSKPYPSDNERRADAGMKAIEASTDCEFRADGLAGLRSDVEDLLADLRHVCDRYELDYGVVDRAAGDVYHGDFQDAPRVGRRGLPPNDGSVANRMGERVAGDE